MLSRLLVAIPLFFTLHTIAPAATVSPKAERQPLAVGAALDAGQRLWLAQIQEGRLVVRVSEDQGRTFSSGVAVSPAGEIVTADAENRPKIAVGRDGIIHLSWTQNLGERMTGFIRYARSTDGGRHFSSPVTLNSDRQKISHRFDSLATDGQGGVAVAWLDARARTGQLPKGSPQTQVGVYAAVSQHGGEHFEADRLVADHSCQCCRTDMVWTPQGPIVFWRHVFGKNVRDFAIADLKGGLAQRVTDDAWEIDGCPHHGGGIASDEAGQLHVVWFTQGTNRQGIFYRRLSGLEFSEGKITRVTTMTAPIPLGHAPHQPGHPAVVASGRHIALTWREFDGTRYVLWAMTSQDAGDHWASPVRLAETHNAADYAVPVIQGAQAMVVWHTADEGLRVFSIGQEK